MIFPVREAVPLLPIVTKESAVVPPKPWPSMVHAGSYTRELLKMPPTSSCAKSGKKSTLTKSPVRVTDTATASVMYKLATIFQAVSKIQFSCPLDINLFCRRDTMKCACRDTLRWNPEDRECQLFVPISCPRIVNGTLMEVSEEEEIQEEEEKEEIEEIPRQINRYGNDQVNRYNRYNDQTANRMNLGNNRYNQRFQENVNRDFERVRHGQQPDVRRQPFEEGKDNEEEEIVPVRSTRQYRIIQYFIILTYDVLDGIQLLGKLQHQI